MTATEPHVEIAGARLMHALSDLTDVAAAIPARDAMESLDKTIKEVLFRDWPEVRSWAESVWQQLNEEFGHAALPDDHPKSPETGVGD